MAGQIYNWKRFWCPRREHLALLDSGFLPDPDERWGRYFNPKVVAFDHLRSYPCLILLGEPGTGKTFTLQAEYQNTRVAVEGDGDQALWFNFRSYGSEDRLCRDLFESNEISAWKHGTHRLHLFLDSLDEGLLGIPTLSVLLADQLRQLPVERLFMRIVCRAVSWPTGLEDTLNRFWKTDQDKVLVLAPLRRSDVIEAATANNLDADAFLAEISHRNAAAFASRPVTLQQLLNIYGKDGALPSTQADLYRRGCLLLCDEPNPDRRDAGRLGSLSIDQRFAVAARIAAITMFANRYAIWTGMDRGDVPDEDVPVHTISGGTEKLSGEDFQVTADGVRETLSTGLFSVCDPERISWSHQTYAEFLAAHYVLQRQMPLPQIRSLLVHPTDPSCRIVPQLHSVATWIAAMSTGVFDEILRCDPAVLLGSDLHAVDDSRRAALTGSLLDAVDEGALLDDDLGFGRQYAALSHPSLEALLRPYIMDGAKGPVVRRVAIDIAAATDQIALVNDLASIALSPSEPISVRESAAHAVGQIGDSHSTSRLRPLAFEEAGDDPNDELKAEALEALWPDHMTAAELFATLTHPKNDHLIGGYHSFLSSDFVQHVSPADLPIALKWCERLGPRDLLPLPTSRVLEAVMARAWDYLDTPGVEDAFARVVLSRLSQFEGVAESPEASLFETDAQKRRQVLATAIQRLAKPEDAPILAQTSTPLATGQDIPWLLGRLLAEESPGAQVAWAKLIWSVHNRHSREHLDAIFEACTKCLVLAEVFAPLFQPVMLDSLDAEKARAFHREQSEWQRRLEERQHQNAPQVVLRRALAALAEYEAGNMGAWPIVTEAMTSDSSSGHPSLRNTDMTASPAWQQVEAETRPRFMQAAHSYVLTIDPDTPTACSNAAGDEPVLAGYKALRLLFQTATDLLATLPSAVWVRWAWVVLVYPLSSGYGDDEIPRALVSTAYQHAPAAVLLHLGRRIDEEDSQDHHIFVLARMRACWDERLSAFLLTKAREPKRSPGGLSTILDTLLAYGVTEAKTYAEFLLTPPPETEDAEPIALAMGLVLMTHAQNASWPVIWTRMTQDVEFGRKLVEAAAAAHGRQVEDLIRRLTEQQIADLYVWLISQYPPTEDPVEYKFHQISPRESVGHWRDALVSQLAERGTRASYEALRGLTERLPNSLQLRWLLLQAHRATLRGTWQRPSPEEILRLAADHETRLVRGGDELLAVLVDSLRRLQEELQGETPTATFLWNEWPGGKYRPKTEEHFSDFVKVHLERDLNRRGVILNREVQIRRGQGGEPGERTDIHVDAVVKGLRVTSINTVTVVIEAKGCWNTGLPDAMEAQLVARYLKDNCEHGLYLIGWFNCNQWDPSDGRRGNSPQIDVAEAQKQFDQQAKVLSRDGIQLRAVVLNTALR